MEPYQKTYIQPGDLLFVDRDNSDGSVPPDECMKDNNTSNATQDNNITAGTTQHTKQVAPVSDPGLRHPFYAGLLISRDADEETIPARVSKRSITYPDTLNDSTKTVSTSIDTHDHAHIFNNTTTSLGDMLKDPQALGVMLETTYNTTTSDEMRQVIACLLGLDIMITKQTHLNEVHEAHTAKNFREQRHLNKDRKRSLGATVKSVEHKFAGLDAQRMAQDRSIKQCEVRANSHQHQLKDLQERVQMLAQGGEWMETEVDGMERVITDLQGEVEGLTVENISLRDEFRGLKEEVRGCKEKEEVWERRLAALEGIVKSKREHRLIELCAKKPVLSAASFAVGNGRVFSFSR